jgi:RNA polymerase sigma-70 factor, ECF subfamily
MREGDGTARSRTHGHTGPSDASLVESARSGQGWALEALYKRYARMVNGLAFRLMAADPEVEDLVQDVFIQAFESLHRLADPDAFGSWIGTITVRTAHKRIRRQRLKRRLGLLRNEPVDFETVIARTAPADVRTELRHVYRVLAELPAEEQVALVLRRVEGLQLADIAQQMDISLATVKRRLDAAETKLARRMSVGGDV